MDSFWSSGKSSMGYFHNSNFLKYFTVDTISTLSRNQKSGFLHVIQHILEVFDELRVRPFLDFLMGCVVRLLVNYAPNIDEERNIGSLAASPSNSDNKENASINHDQVKWLLVLFAPFAKVWCRLSMQTNHYCFFHLLWNSCLA